MQAKESQLVSQSILRLGSEQRTVVQTRAPYAGSSELVYTVRDRSGSQASPLSPSGHGGTHDSPLWRFVVGHKEVAEA